MNITLNGYRLKTEFSVLPCKLKTETRGATDNEDLFCHTSKLKIGIC